jgi:hypothetical protein
MPQRTIDGCDCALCRRDRQWAADLLDPSYVDDDESYEDEYDDDEPERVIHSHGWNPTDLEFRGQGPVFLGMELEVNVPERSFSRDSWERNLDRWASKVQTGLGDVVWLQEDGSISYGFEITTHPMSYQWAMDNFPWEYLSTMEENGCWVDRNVGIHVHVSRSAFRSECHMYRWMKFVYRNERQVSRLARRRGSQWASFDPSYRVQAKHYMKGPADPYVHTRYQAINPTKRDTVEVRVFASSLRPREVQSALAFVDSTVIYTRDLDANKILKERGWAWDSYVTWLRSRPEYRPLVEELEALSCVS